MDAHPRQVLKGLILDSRLHQSGFVPVVILDEFCHGQLSDDDAQVGLEDLSDYHLHGFCGPSDEVFECHFASFVIESDLTEDKSLGFDFGPLFVRGVLDFSRDREGPSVHQVDRFPGPLPEGAFLDQVDGRSEV